MDGAHIERQWMRKKIWLSSLFVFRALVVLALAEAGHRTWLDIVATIKSLYFEVAILPQNITAWFLYDLWRLTLCGE